MRYSNQVLMPDSPKRSLMAMCFRVTASKSDLEKDQARYDRTTKDNDITIHDGTI